MIRAPHAWLLPTLVLTLLAAGCPSGDGGNNDGDGDGTTQTDLSAEQKALVELAGQQLAAAVAALNPLGGLVDPELNLINFDDVTFGECPRVTVNRSGMFVTITLDFAAGCSSDFTAGRTVSGRIIFGLTFGDATATIQFDDLVIDGRSVTGGATLAFTGDVSTALTFVGTISISTDGVGAATGEVELTAARDGLVTIETADLLLSNGTDQVQVGADDIEIDAASNGNLVPQDGTLTLVVPSVGPAGGTDTAVVRFAATSPDDLIVFVSLDGGDEFEYELGSAGD